MKCKLIILPERNIIVSDEKIEKGDWVAYDVAGYNDPKYPSHFIGKVKSTDEVGQANCHYSIDGGTEYGDNCGWHCEDCFKIIAGTPESPSIDYNDSEEEFGIVDMEKILSKNIDDNRLNNMTGKYKYMFGFETGFKSAQSLNDKEFNFSQEEMFQLFLDYADYYSPRNEARGVTINRFIKTLQQPKVFDIEVDTVKLRRVEGVFVPEPRITNNSIKIVKIIR